MNEAKSPAMSPQQRAVSADGSLLRYRRMIVGDRGWLTFVGFELYSILFSNLPSLLGIALRRVFAPFFLARTDRGLVIGKGVTIRQPGRIEVGHGVIIDDFATIDVREDPSSGGVDQTPGIFLGDHVLIGRNSIVVAKNGQIRLGRACNVGSHCRIATQSRIEIGESVLIAAYAYIGPGNHQVSEDHQPLIERSMDIRGGVTIGDHAWIGARATILDGVTIGTGAVIGAHSLVLEDVPEGAIVAGTPAKVIRYREDVRGAGPQATELN